MGAFETRQRLGDNPRRLVIGGVGPILHAPGSAAELAAQVAGLQSNPTRTGKMGRKGRTWLVRSTRPEDWLARFLEIVVRVIALKRRGDAESRGWGAGDAAV